MQEILNPYFWLLVATATAQIILYKIIPWCMAQLDIQKNFPVGLRKARAYRFDEEKVVMTITFVRSRRVVITQ